jgi:hypothetical protein
MSAIGKATALLEPLPGVMGVRRGIVDGQLEVDLAVSVDHAASDDHQATNGILDALVRAEIPVLSFEIEGDRLQDAFMQLTEGARS